MWSKYASVKTMPPGYRFAPTDEELMFYLRNKVLIKSIPSQAVRDIDVNELYSYPPNEIVDDPRRERGEWYFCIHRDKHQNKRKEKENIPMDGNWTCSWKKEAFFEINESGNPRGNWIGKEKQENANFRMTGKGIGKDFKEEKESNCFDKNYNNENIFDKDFPQEGQEKGKIRIVGNGIGFWKSVGKEDPIYDDSGRIFAFKIHFIYFSGSTRKGKKTHWRMEEYHLLHEQDLKKEELMLGRVTRGRDYS